MSFTQFDGTSRLLASDVARKATFDEIPIVSLSASPEQLINTIRDACTRVGFFYISDHGVPQLIIDTAFDFAEKFFTQNSAAKDEVHTRKSKTMMGYEPVAEVQIDKSRKPDLKEAFAWCYEEELDPDFHPEGEDDQRCSNQWPSSPTGFKPAIGAYYGSLLQLARRMIRLFAQALDLPVDYFDAMVSRPGAMGNILHYPPQPPTDPDAIGIGAHTDFECFTILCQKVQPGLQVLNPHGEWILAPPVPGTFVVNIGDMLARWSNDVFVSTVHRVLNMTGEERYSIPVFFGPNYDTVIEPLRTCVSEGRVAKYKPVLAGDYVFRRLSEMYKPKKDGEER